MENTVPANVIKRSAIKRKRRRVIDDDDEPPMKKKRVIIDEDINSGQSSESEVDNKMDSSAEASEEPFLSMIWSEQDNQWLDTFITETASPCLIDDTAKDILNEAAEEFLIGLFSDANTAAMQNDRTRIQPRDLLVARKLASSPEPSMIKTEVADARN